MKECEMFDYVKDDQDLIPANQRVNRVILPADYDADKRRRKFIDLTDPEDNMIKNCKKTTSNTNNKNQKTNTDPFLKLGEDINTKVN